MLASVCFKVGQPGFAKPATLVVDGRSKFYFLVHKFVN